MNRNVYAKLRHCIATTSLLASHIWVVGLRKPRHLYMSRPVANGSSAIADPILVTSVKSGIWYIIGPISESGFADAVSIIPLVIPKNECSYYFSYYVICKVIVISCFTWNTFNHVPINFIYMLSKSITCHWLDSILRLLDCDNYILYYAIFILTDTNFLYCLHGTILYFVTIISFVNY